MSLRYRYNLHPSKSDPPPTADSKKPVHHAGPSVVVSSHHPETAKGLKKALPHFVKLISKKKFYRSCFDYTNLQIAKQGGVPDGVFQKFTPSEIRRLGRRFQKLDSDHSGTVSLKEFLKIPEISKNVLANRIVEVFDTNRNGEVDFREFVLGMSQFSCAENAEGRLRFAFRIYDMDGNGFISNGELFQVLKCMVGNNLTDIQIQEAVDHTFMIGDTDHDGQISFKEFSALVKNNTSIQSGMVIKGI